MPSVIAPTIVGSWGTKIEAVVGTIINITMEDQTAKIIVFSQWEDVLTIIEQALNKNRVQSVRIKGSNKINQKLKTFKTNHVSDDFFTCCCLLPGTLFNSYFLPCLVFLILVYTS